MKETSFIVHKKDDTLNFECDYIDTLKFLSVGVDKLINNYEKGISINTNLYNDFNCFINCNLALDKICLLGIEEHINNILS